MSSKDEFIIPFEGLKLGKHPFKFHIKNTFFEELTYSIIKGGDVKINFTLTKKETMMIGQFEMVGTVRKQCDRCNDLMDIPISVSQQIIYTFSEEESFDENLKSIPQSAFTIDISSTLYELLTVALPDRAVHEEDQCNEEMLDLLDKYEYSPENEENIDSRWDKLKKLK